MSFLRFLLLFPLAMALLVGPHFMAACSTQHKAPPDQPPAEKQAPIAPDATKHEGKVEEIKEPLGAATQAAEKATPETWAKDKPDIMANLRKSWDATLVAIKSATALKTKAEGLDKANAAAFEREKRKDAALEQAAQTINQQNEVIADQRAENERIKRGNARNALTLGIIACFVAILVGAVLCKFDWTWGLLVSGGGAAGMACGILAISFNNFVQQHETAIGIGILVLGVGVVGGGLWFAYLRLRGGVNELVKGNNALIAAGVIDMEEAGPILDAVQNPFTKKRLVDPLKPAQTKQTKQPDMAPIHIYPTMSATDTLRMNDGVANHKGGSRD